jgi:hypothetical protein
MSDLIALAGPGVTDPQLLNVPLKPVALLVLDTAEALVALAPDSAMERDGPWNMDVVKIESLLDLAGTQLPHLLPVRDDGLVVTRSAASQREDEGETGEVRKDGPPVREWEPAINRLEIALKLAGEND